MKNLMVLFISLFVFSCSDSFLSGEPSSEKYLGESFPIVVSPGWEAKEYGIYCQGAGNAGYTAGHVPVWLNITPLSGQFVNDTAFLICKTNGYNLFSEAGLYCTYITLSVENNGIQLVPTVYTVEGNPAVEVPDRLTFGPDDLNQIVLPIKNTGNGVLTWSVSKYPEWLSLKYNPGTMVARISALAQNGIGTIVFSCNPVDPFLEVLSGKIVLTTNDRNNPEVEVPIDLKIR